MLSSEWICFKKEQCVLCGSKQLSKLLDLPSTPIANQLMRSQVESISQNRFPLNLVICEICEHIQIEHIINPSILFSDYPYLSKTGAASVERLGKLADEITLKVGKPSFALEIGSNDGFLLSLLKDRKWKVVGVDPAREPVELALKSGVFTYCEFFNESLAKDVVETHGRPDVIIANNVLAHTNNLQDIFIGIRHLMSENTLLIMEFSYVLSIFNDLLFDTIYHEHTSYHSLHSLGLFLANLNLEIIEIKKIETHGGSLRLYIELKKPDSKAKKEVLQFIDEENRVELNKIDNWIKFKERINNLSTKLNKELTQWKQEGRQIVGYGVPAKFTTLFYGLEISTSLFDFFVDDNLLKIGKFAPGTGLQIKSTVELKNLKNLGIVIFSWNYSEDIISKIQNLNVKNTKVITPLPTYTIFDI